MDWNMLANRDYLQGYIDRCDEKIQYTPIEIVNMWNLYMDSIWNDIYNIESLECLLNFLVFMNVEV